MCGTLLNICERNNVKKMTNISHINKIKSGEKKYISLMKGCQTLIILHHTLIGHVNFQTIPSLKSSKTFIWM